MTRLPLLPKTELLRGRDMKHPLLVVAVPLLLACSLAGGALAQGAPSEPPTATATPPQASTTAACGSRSLTRRALLPVAAGHLPRSQSALALKLLAAQRDHGSSPVVVSPAGIAAVLGALDLGADQPMRDAILATLQFKGKATGTTAQTEELRRALRLFAAGPGDGSLTGVNALFVDLKQPLKAGVAERLVAEAQMPVKPVDLASSVGIREVNTFVSDNTKGRVPAILGANDIGAALVAVNAFHFLGCWQVPFSPKETRPAAFTTLDGKSVQVPTMSLSNASISHKIEGRFAAVDLAYDDPRYSLVLVTTTDKPGKPSEFSAAQSLLEGAGFVQAPAVLELPRFKIETGADLLPTLSSLGLGTGLKSPTALAGLADGIRLSAVQQKTFIVVDEQGTEAVAVTAAVATRGAVLRPEAISFNKPFVFALRDKPTGLILLAGYVADPSKEE